MVLCAWFGGLFPGLFSTALGGFIAWFVFIPPQYSLKVSDRTAPAQLAVFLVAGALISHPDDRDRVLADIASAVEGNRQHHIEYRIVRPDGAIRWVEGRGQLFRRTLTTVYWWERVGPPSARSSDGTAAPAKP